MANTKKQPNLKTFYKEKVVKALTEKFGYKNVMQVPRLEKVVINMGVGDAVNDRKFLTAAQENMDAISGQKSVVTKARNSVASFKIREEWPIGCKVTLRGERMYEFLERLLNIALPRVKDFRGLNSRSFDGRGNYSMGLKEQIVFPEIEYDKIDKIRGMDITITTTAPTNEEGLALLRELKFPFRETQAAVDASKK